MVGPCIGEPDFLAKGEILRTELNLDGLLVTRSDKGMVLFERDEEPFIQPTRRVKCTMSLVGRYRYRYPGGCIGSECNLVEATQIANLAGGIVVRKLGTATTRVEEIQTEMLKHTPQERGVTDEDALLESLLEMWTP